MRRLVVVLCLFSCAHNALASDDVFSPLDEVLRADPGHHGARYYAARTAARRGEVDRALQYLRDLEANAFDDALERNDFASLAQNREFQSIASRLERRAPPRGQAALFAETRCADLLPEGTAYDPKRKELLVSSGHQRNIVAIRPDGRCRTIVSDSESGLLAVLGMQVDTANDRLWVANTHAPFMKGVSERTEGQAQLSCIDLNRGVVVKHYPLPVKGLANDVTLLSNGDVLVTESVGGAVYRWRSETDAIETEWPAGSFEGPNGLVALASGDVVVADFHGLWLLPVARGSVHEKFKLQTPEQRYLGGIDGLARRGDTLVAIQNLVGRGRVWSFTVDVAQRRVEQLQLRLRNHPDLLNPTTGVVADGAFYFVADPDLQQSNTPKLKPLPRGRRGHRVLMVAL